MASNLNPEVLERIAQSRLDIANSRSSGVLGLTNQDKIGLANTGIAELLEATMEKNRLKRNPPLTFDEHLKLNLKPIRWQEDEELNDLVDKIMRAADGKPAKVSISAEKDKEQMAQSFLRQFILKAMVGDTASAEEESMAEEKKE